VTKAWADICSQVIITTLKKQPGRKALVSDLNKLAKPSLIVDHGDDNAAASSKTPTITQAIKGHGRQLAQRTIRNQQ